MKYRSLHELYQDRIAERASLEAYRYKKDSQWISVTWDEFGKQIRNIALSLVDLGLAKGDVVAVLSQTRPEWEIVDKAINMFGGITVGIYPTLPSDQVLYILAHSEAKAVIVENQEQLDKVAQVKNECPNLKSIIVIERIDGDEKPLPSFPEMMSFSAEKEQKCGEKLDAFAADIKLEDPSTYIYTSGTTGPPKAAIITHSNMLYEGEFLSSLAEVRPDDLTLTWLPFAHIFQRATTIAGIYAGSATAFAESIDKLLANLGEVKPSIFYSVPRVYEKAYSKIIDQAKNAGFPKTQLFFWSMKIGRQVSQYRQKKAKIPALLQFKFRIAQKLVFQKIKQVFGGRIRFIATSGAPIAKEILEFFHAADILTLEAYGATETTAGVTMNLPEEYRFGTVGKSGSDLEIKIAEDGEILVHGSMVFAGYFKDPEKTKEVLSDDGWYSTGDVGRFDEAGFLMITDRKKDIIVTSGGKNISPQNIENLLKKSVYISQAMVHGDRRNYLTCLLTLDPDTLVPWAKTTGLPTEDWAALCENPQIVELINSEVAKVNSELARYETIKYFRILPDEFTIDSGEMTPTLKVKRRVVEKRYKDLLDSMYTQA